jgi:hypothetical protein
MPNALFQDRETVFAMRLPQAFFGAWTNNERRFRLETVLWHTYIWIALAIIRPCCYQDDEIKYFFTR